MIRVVLLGAASGIASLLTFHQAMWTAVWLWSAGRFPRPYHLFLNPRAETVDVVLLYAWGAFWGIVAASLIARWPRRKPAEIGLCVGVLLTLLHPVILMPFVLHPLMGGGPLSPVILDNVLLPAIPPYLAINMAWGIGVGLIYPWMSRRFGQTQS